MLFVVVFVFSWPKALKKLARLEGGRVAIMYPVKMNPLLRLINSPNQVKGVQPSPDENKSGEWEDTHITAVEGELQKVWRTVSHHVLESIIVQPEILWMGVVGRIQERR